MSDADIAAALDLGELRGAFIALKHAHNKVFFKDNLEEILKFAEDSKPSLLFQTYLKMLMTYLQRRSKLNSTAFNNIVEQLKPNKNMATAFKPFWEVGEAKAEKRGMDIAETKAKLRERQTIIRLIQTTRLDNSQIAGVVDVQISLVEAIRLELKKAT